MKKQILTTAIVLTSIFSATQALAFLPLKPSKKMMNKVSTSKQQQKKNVYVCADFSGDWVGTCEDKGVQTQAKLILDQQGGCLDMKMKQYDEDSKVWESFNLSLTSGISSQTEASGLINLNTSRAFAWNSDQSVIVGKAQALMNSPFFALIDYSADIQIMLDGNDLLVSSTYSISTEGPGQSTCRYQKVTK